MLDANDEIGPSTRPPYSESPVRTHGGHWRYCAGSIQSISALPAPSTRSATSGAPSSWSGPPRPITQATPPGQPIAHPGLATFLIIGMVPEPQMHCLGLIAPLAAALDPRAQMLVDELAHVGAVATARPGVRPGHWRGQVELEEADPCV